MAPSSIAQTLIYADSVSWNQGSRQPTLVTYSFASLAGGPNGSAAGLAWQPFNGAQQASARQALQAWDQNSGVVFVEVPDTAAGAGIDLRFQLNSMDSGTAGYAYFPENGDISLSLALYRDEALAQGSYGYYILLHEVGHALGLKHSFERFPTLPVELENTDTTVMSYVRAGFTAPDNLRAADLEAIQYLYGSTAYEASFHTHWRWDASLSGIRHDGNDTAQSIEGTAFRDIIFGYGGNDVLSGGGGNDVINAGSGANTVAGGGGNDVLATDAYRFQISLTGLRATVEYDPASHATQSGRLYRYGEDTSFSGIESLGFADGRLTFDGDDAVAQVTRLYQAALGRVPDAPGREMWTGLLQHGTALAGLAESFLGSAEFQARFGALDNTGFIARAYEQALGRAPDAQGTAFWQAKLAGGMTRAELLTGFSESAENRVRTAAPLARGLWDADDATVEVARLYQAVLGRGPDATGLDFWTGQREAGLSLQEIGGRFADSAEFGSRFAAPGDDAFIRLVYANTLGRGPDAGGLGFWADKLAHGTGRGELVAGFSGSDEFVHLSTGLLDQGGITFA